MYSNHRERHTARPDQALQRQVSAGYPWCPTYFGKQLRMMRNSSQTMMRVAGSRLRSWSPRWWLLCSSASPSLSSLVSLLCAAAVLLKSYQRAESSQQSAAGTALHYYMWVYSSSRLEVASLKFVSSKVASSKVAPLKVAPLKVNRV